MSCENCAVKASIERLRRNCRDCRRCGAVAGNGQVSLDAIHDGTTAQVLDVAPGVQTSYTFDPCDGIEPQPDENNQGEQTIQETLQTFVSCIARLPYDEAWRVAAVADTFRGMSRIEFEIAVHLIRGGDLVSYTRANGLTRQTAHARFKTFFRAHPIFRSIISTRARAGKAGAA